MSFTGAGLKSTFGLRGVDDIGSAATGVGVLEELGLVGGGVEVDSRRVKHGWARYEGVNAKLSHLLDMTAEVRRRVVIDLLNSSDPK